MSNLNFIAAKSFMILAISLFSLSAISQEKFDKSITDDLSTTSKIALGVQSELHIKAAIKIYEQLVHSGVIIEEFEVVIWGKVVEELVDNSELIQFIEEHQNEKLKLSVCQVAMDRLDVSSDDLPKGVTPVPNAWVRMIQLQAKGYQTLIP